MYTILGQILTHLQHITLEICYASLLLFILRKFCAVESYSVQCLLHNCTLQKERERDVCSYVRFYHLSTSNHLMLSCILFS